jgi:PAS domain S-box-containing protein
MFGYAHDDLSGKAIEALIPEHVRPRHQHHLASYAAAPRLRPMGSNLDLRGRRKDGSEFPVEISLSPFETERGVLIIAGVRDVTDRRQLERENKRANAYLVSAVDAVQDAFALFDEHDRVMMVNSAARQLLGSATGESIVGRRFSDLLEEALTAGVFDVGDESPAAFQRRWLAYHQAPAGTLEVCTGAGRDLRVTDRKTADLRTLPARGSGGRPDPGHWHRAHDQQASRGADARKRRIPERGRRGLRVLDRPAAPPSVVRGCTGRSTRGRDAVAACHRRAATHHRVRRGQPIEHRVHARAGGGPAERGASDRSHRRDRAGVDPHPPAASRDHGHQPSRHQRIRGGRALARMARDPALSRSSDSRPQRWRRTPRARRKPASIAISRSR